MAKSVAEVDDADVALAPLDPAHVGPAELRLLGERLLAVAPRGPEAAAGSCGRASGSAAGLDEVLDLEAVAGWVSDAPNEGDLLPGTVLDGVRVGVGAHASGAKVPGPHRQ
jgi:hypothetical protein